MNPLNRSIVAPVLMVCVFVVSGCGPHREMGISTSGVSWMNLVEDPTPGIHEGSTSVLALKNGSSTKTTVVVWADVSGAQPVDHREGEYRLPKVL